MDDFRVPKRRVLAQLVLPGGETRELFVFLAEAVPGRSGGERLSDLLNGQMEFIPAVDAATGTMTFVKCASVALARVDAEHERSDEDQLTILTEHEVELRLVDGQRLKGLITYVLPEEHSRLTDFLNSASPFLRLLQGSQAALINKRHIAYVETSSR